MIESNKNIIRSVDRALDLLSCFIERKQWTLTELTEQTGLHKTTVFRLLATLVQRGFLLRDAETEKYRLGLRIWELSLNMDHITDPAVLVLSQMEKLRDLLDETISLYIRDGTERIRIQATESRQTIRRVAPLGERMSLAVGASSKVLVAFAESHLLEQVLTDSSWPTTADQAAYRLVIAQTKQRGYAISVEERESGTTAIAVPIFNRRSNIVAALAVSGPVSRIGHEQMIAFLPHLQQAAQQMGLLLV